MLAAKTKKYQIPVKTFVRVGMELVIKELWWSFLIPLVLIIPGVVLGGSWMLWLSVSAVVLLALYFLFWYIQFYGISQMPQGKPLFEKMSYELDNNQLLIRKNQKEGMMLKWDQIGKVAKLKTGYVFKLSKFQFIFLPYDIFNSENDLKFTDTLLKRKKLLLEKA